MRRRAPPRDPFSCWRHGGIRFLMPLVVALQAVPEVARPGRVPGSAARRSAPAKLILYTCPQRACIMKDVTAIWV